MDEIFSYWPLIFFVIAIFSRIMKNVNKDKKVIKKSKVNTKPLNDEKNTNEQFTFDEDDNIIKKTNNNTTNKKDTRQKEKKQIKKIQIKKEKTTNNMVLFRNKDDIIRGIIVKEVLDNPKYID